MHTQKSYHLFAMLYILPYNNTCIHAYRYAHMHTYMQVYVHTYMHTICMLSKYIAYTH